MSGKAPRRRAKKRSALRTEKEVREGLKVIVMSLVNVRKELRAADGGVVDFNDVIREVQLAEQYRTLKWFLREDVSRLDLEEGDGHDDKPTDKR